MWAVLLPRVIFQWLLCSLVKSVKKKQITKDLKEFGESTAFSLAWDM